MPSADVPTAATPFVGRAEDLARIASLISDPTCRLLTLVGPGGIGKTRLATEAAQAISSAFADGVYFVRLQPVQSAELIMPTIADSIGFACNGAQNVDAQVRDFLSNQRMLLILDNFEHLLDGINLIARLLVEAPQIKLIVTSRQALNLRGEWLYVVEGLQTPIHDKDDDAGNFDAVTLFVTSARRVRFGFTLDNCRTEVAQICRLVEGMPLALELAAMWVRALSLSVIIEQLEAGLELLTSSQSDLPARHQSIRSVFDTSWQWLSEAEQVVFSSMSVFRGGFTAEAAMQVTGASALQLAALIDKSLIQLGVTGRYDLHELLRQYAAEKLDQSPDLKSSVLERHCEYYTEFLHRHEATIHLSDRGEVLQAVDNLRAAWSYAAQQRKHGAILRAAPALYWLYHFQSWFDEGAAMFRIAEDSLPELPETDEDRFLLGMIRLFRYAFQPKQPGQVQAEIESALSLWEGLEERREMSLPLTRAMLISLGHSNDPGQISALAHKAIAFSRRQDDLAGAAISLSALAVVSYSAFGDFAKARELLEEALALDQQIGFHLNARWAEGLLGNIALLQGRYGVAKAHYEASISHHHAGEIIRALDVHLLRLGMAALELGEDDVAREHIEASIRVANDLRQPPGIAEGHAAQGLLSAYQGEVDAATGCYLDTCNYLRTKHMDPLRGGEDMESLRLLALLSEHYEHALLYYEAYLDRCEKTGFRVPILQCRSRLGHTLLGLADETRAKPHLLDTFREAHAIGAYQVQLEALSGIAQLSFIPLHTAIELLALAREHPTANRYTRHRASRVLATMETSLLRENFLEAIERGRKLSFEAAMELVESFAFDLKNISPENQRLMEPLSTRELEVLSLVAAGLTNHEIAEQLHIGISTVKKHINHIYDKLDTTHRAQAVARARSLHLLA